MVKGEMNTASLFYKDKRISDVCYLMDEAYYEIWEKGVNEYLEGNWEKALEHINKTLDYKREDKPNQMLLQYIHSFDDKCPKNWKGYRDYSNFSSHMDK